MNLKTDFIQFLLSLSIVFISVYTFSLSYLCVLPVVTFFVYNIYKEQTKNKLNEENSGKGLLFNKNVIVTGGSSGIGKCVAIIAAENGANVTIVARNREKLEMARDEIFHACRDKENQKIECLVLDVSQDYDTIEKALMNLERQQGPCYMLVNCAGMAVCGKIEDINHDLVKYMVNLNLLGSYYCTKAIVRSMKQAKQGKIVFVSSQAGLLGIFGYSGYCCTKFALKGLAETLAMELIPHNVSVTLCLPPDTDTPGFETEQESKPMETKLISESGGLVQPEVVAQQLMDDALNGKFFSIVGKESFVLTTLCSGMSPSSSFFELILQSILMGPFKLFGAIVLYQFKRIVVKCANFIEMQKKPE